MDSHQEPHLAHSLIFLCKSSIITPVYYGGLSLMKKALSGLVNLAEKRPWRWHILLFGSAFLLRLLVILWHNDMRLVTEMHGYVDSARDMLAGGDFSGMPGLKSFLPPGLSFFYMGLMWIFGPANLLVLRIAQAVLGAATANLTYSAGASWQDRKLGVLAGIIFALLPMNVFQPDFLLTEALFTFLSTLGFLIICADPSKVWRWCLTGLIWGVATLVRPILLYFPLFLLVSSIIIFRKQLPWKGILLALVLAAATISPWTLRNYHEHCTFMPVESKSGLDFFIFNHGTFHDLLVNYSDEDEEREIYFSVDTEAARSSAFLRAGVSWIINNPHLFAFKTIRNAANFYGLERDVHQHLRWDYYGPQPGWLTWGLLPIVVIPSAALLVFLVPGMVLTQKSRTKELPVLLLFVYASLIAMVAFGYSRHRYPLTPFIILYAARAWLAGRQALPGSLTGWRRTAVWVWWGFLAAGWILEVAIDFGAAFDFLTTGKPLT